ncbi:MAG: hypothetical protein IPI04_18685 [Ignavibacteria bacterium]|nr:hypothetical protein [Ignavibacteria bacterium]
MNIRGGSTFSAPLQINTGTTTLIDQNLLTLQESTAVNNRKWSNALLRSFII